MKYSWKGHKVGNRDKNLNKKRVGKLSWLMCKTNCNVLTMWRWACGETGVKLELLNNTLTWRTGNNFSLLKFDMLPCLSMYLRILVLFILLIVYLLLEGPYVFNFRFSDNIDFMGSSNGELQDLTNRLLRQSNGIRMEWVPAQKRARSWPTAWTTSLQIYYKWL